MNTQHLRYAVEVERTGSIRQAAENLYMGQPNLSKAIRELESNLGVTLFKRSPRGVTITPDGTVFLRYARAILDKMDEVEALYRPQNARRQRFSIAVPRASYIALAFARFAAALDLAEEIDLNYKETNSLRTIHSVLDGEYSLGIIRFQESFAQGFWQYLRDKGMAHEELWSFEYVALMSAQHPLAGAETLRHRDLREHVELVHGDLSVPFLSDEDGAPPAASPAKRQIRVYERGGQFDLLVHIPSSYMWVSPMPQEILKRHGLVQRPCADMRQHYKDVLVYPEGRRFSEMDKAFLAQLHRVRDEISGFLGQDGV